jgi:hypothetical protein
MEKEQTDSKRIKTELDSSSTLIPTSVSDETKPTLTFVSGGASGADFLWTNAALRAGHHVQVMSFHGHSIQAPNGVQVIKLGQDVLDEATPYVEAAAKTLKRNVPSSAYALKLLQRDWHIVKDVDAVFAIGRQSTKHGLGIDSGTGRGCQMYFERTVREQIPLRLWLFDQCTTQWLQCIPTERGCRVIHQIRFVFKK